MYHHSEKPRVVNNQEDLEALGEEWVESPADVKQPDADAADEEKPTKKRK